MSALTLEGLHELSGYHAGYDTLAETVRSRFINPAATALLGYTEEELLGQDSHRMLHHSHIDGSHYAVEDCPMHLCLHSGITIRDRESTLWHRDGTPLPLECSHTPIVEDGRIIGAVTTLRDIRDRKRYLEQLERHSNYDELTDLPNRNLLYDIDRLSIAAGAWDRLWRVYTRLVEDTFDREEKIELLTRHADLLQKHGADPAAALERVLQICKLDPEREEALTRAEALATEADSDSELLWIYENLYKSADSDERRAYYLLRAARVSDHGLKDREQAVMNLTRALALTEELPQVAGEIEDLARELDRSRPELGEDDARRALIRAHMELAPDMGEPYGPMLVLRASQLLKDELNDAPACFDALKQGAGLFPNDMVIYDALEEAGLKIKRLDALDAHLARSSQRATDPEVKLGLLERRARLNAAHLERPAKAAEAYREMLALDPRHEEANTGLLSALRKAGRYQDLLRAFNERLERTSDTDARVELLRQIAGLWEVELKNRPSAIETWRQVQELAPEDGEASAALSRLQRTA